MNNYTITNSLVKTLSVVEEYNAAIDRDREAKRAKPMTYTKPQHPAQPALPTAEPASTPRPEASKPTQPSLNPELLRIRQQYKDGELTKWEALNDIQTEVAWNLSFHEDSKPLSFMFCALQTAIEAAWRDQSGMGTINDENLASNTLTAVLRLWEVAPLHLKRSTRIPGTRMEDLPEYGDPNFRIETRIDKDRGIVRVPVRIEPAPKFALPFAIPHLEVQRYIDPATTDLWEQIELIALSEICCKMYSGGQSGSGDGLSLAPHRCGRCPACIAHKAEQIQWRLRRMAQAGPIYGKIVSEAEHDKLVRKYGKRSTFSAPLADGNRWTVVNVQFDGSQQLNSEFTAEVVRREIKDWLNKLVRNVPEGKRLANLDLASDKLERIMVHRFSVTDQYKPQAERLYSEAERETGLSKPTTREEAQARVKAAWPIFEAKAKAANLPLLNVREGWARCDLISDRDTSYLRLSDETPAELLARLTATGQMPPDSGNCPF